MNLQLEDKPFVEIRPYCATSPLPFVPSALYQKAFSHIHGLSPLLVHSTVRLINQQFIWTRVKRYLMVGPGVHLLQGQQNHQAHWIWNHWVSPTIAMLWSPTCGYHMSPTPIWWYEISIYSYRPFHLVSWGDKHSTNKQACKPAQKPSSPAGSAD